MYKGLVNRESLRATDGVKYFRSTLRRPPKEVSTEIEDGKRGALPSVMGPNIRWRIAEKTSPAEAQTSSCAGSSEVLNEALAEEVQRGGRRGVTKLQQQYQNQNQQHQPHET